MSFISADAVGRLQWSYHVAAPCFYYSPERTKHTKHKERRGWICKFHCHGRFSYSAVVFKMALGLETGLKTTFWRSWSHLEIKRILNWSCLGLSDKVDSGFVIKTQLRPQQTYLLTSVKSWSWFVWFWLQHYLQAWKRRVGKNIF